MKPIIDIKNLGFDSGAHVLIKLELSKISVGETISVTGSAPHWSTQLAAWCRDQGHSVSFNLNTAFICKGHAQQDRWALSEKAGDFNSAVEIAKSNWGLSARGAQVEAGSPEFNFKLNHKSEIWSNMATELYTQAAANQWNPETAIDWSAPKMHSQDLENAVVQVMTYMIENENAALLVPARFLAQLHPHFREIQALLSIQIADEARHIDVFTKRIRLYGQEPALSTSGGQASLKTLLDEADFSVAEFLLSVLGEGTFVDLLQFLSKYGPDPVTRQICLLAGRDESRHVVFGLSHLRESIEKRPELLHRLAHAIENRFEGLSKTNGLNSEVFDSLILIAAGGTTPESIAEGYSRVQNLLQVMAEGRKSRLEKLGFTSMDSKRLASLHTRNFM